MLIFYLYTISAEPQPDCLFQVRESRTGFPPRISSHMSYRQIRAEAAE